MSTELSPNDALLRRIKTRNAVSIQNTLMRVSDREIALAMMYMEDRDRGYLFSLLSQKKVSRIREELTLHSRLRITYDQYNKAVSAIIEALESGGKSGQLKSYLRPRK